MFWDIYVLILHIVEGVNKRYKNRLLWVQRTQKEHTHVTINIVCEIYRFSVTKVIDITCAHTHALKAKVKLIVIIFFKAQSTHSKNYLLINTPKINYKLIESRKLEQEHAPFSTGTIKLI